MQEKPTGMHETASSSAECSRDKPPFGFVRGQDSTMWDIVWVSPQGHRSVSVSRHFLLQAPQCPCSVQKRFSRDHCCWGRSKPGCQIVGSHTRWELTTWVDFQLCLHWLFARTWWGVMMTMYVLWRMLFLASFWVNKFLSKWQKLDVVTSLRLFELTKRGRIVTS